MTRAYYNEHDPKAAAWLRQLIAGGHIAPGDVDTRSVLDVTPADLAQYTQCHFFAGIGGWSLALRQAGWPDTRAVWTGSCPCQSFSTAGKQKGFADARHLWPAWFWLIRQCAPPVVFGEQVASKDGLAWLDFVCLDLENTGHAVGAFDICAAGVGAPHLRQRLWWVAIANGGGFQEHAQFHSAAPNYSPEGRTQGGHPGGHGEQSWLANATGERSQGPAERSQDWLRGPVHGRWEMCHWLPFTDGKTRPVEPGTFPVAHGIPNRVGLLRGYGNAIVPQVAAEYIKAYLAVCP